MTESKFRIWTKSVAIAELVLISVAIAILCFVSATFILKVCGVVPPNNESSNEKSDAAVLVAYIIGLGILVVCMKYSCSLFKATTKGTESTVALRKAVNWRLFSLVILLLSLGFLGMGQQLPLKGVGIVLKSIFICVVHFYIGDLEIAAQENNECHFNGLPLEPA